MGDLSGVGGNVPRPPRGPIKKEGQSGAEPLKTGQQPIKGQPKAGKQQGTTPQQGQVAQEDPNAENVKTSSTLAGQEQVSETKTPKERAPTKLDTQGKVIKTTGEKVADKTEQKIGQNEAKRNELGISLVKEKPILAAPRISEGQVPEKIAQAVKQVKANQKNGIPIQTAIARTATNTSGISKKEVQDVTTKLLAMVGKSPKQQLMLINKLMGEVINKFQMTMMEKDVADLKKTSESEQEYFKEIGKREKAREASKGSNIVQKIFKWLGAILQVIAAIIVKVLAIVASVATFGAASPLAGLATMLLISAIMSVVILILEESGGMQALTEKVIAPLLIKMGLSKDKAQLVAGILVMAFIIGLQIMMMVSSGGTSAAGSGAQIANTTSQTAIKVSKMAKKLADWLQPMLQTMMKTKDAEAAMEMSMMIMEVSNRVSQAVIQTGQAATTVAQSVSSYQTGKAESGMLEQKKVQGEVTFSKDEMAEFIKLMEKLKQKMAKEMSVFIEQDKKTMSAILSRIGTA